VTPDDLAAMKALHVRGRGATGEVGDDPTLFPNCLTCIPFVPFPCSVRRLLDEVEACHGEIRGLKALFMPDGVE